MNPKQLAAEKAVSFIENGMIVGLGTGSTAYFAIEKIGERIKSERLKLSAIATSKRSEEHARALNIPIISFADIDEIDLTIDGADEVDEQLNLIKGGGGALLREKIVAFNSDQLIIVVDESKLVKHLGKFLLPVEIAAFGWEMTLRKLQIVKCKSQLRMKDNDPYITDNNNYIIDCDFKEILFPAILNDEIDSIPGVVENGLFVGMANKVIAGYENGEVKIFTKK
ncbi:MAG: ribose-5-phosphate isomerase RpiA [Chitinophagaceae bacterium]